MPRRNRWAEQAALEALLRFGPEVSGLEALQREAVGQYRQGVKQARGTSRAVVQSVRAARPQIRRVYDDLGETVQQANAVTAPNMAGVPASMRAAMEMEQAGFTRRTGESEAAALSDLSSRAVGAREGRAFGVQQARTQLRTDLQKIFERRLDLAREQGAFQQLTARELRQEARQRADEMALAQTQLSQSERESLRSAGIDPNTGRPMRGGDLDQDGDGRPGGTAGGGSGGGGSGSEGNRGRGWASQEQHAAAQDQIQEAIRWAKRLRGAGLGRGDVAAALSSGREAADILDPRTGKPVINPDGTKRRRGAIPQIKSQLLLSTALDEVFDNHVSRRNQRLLHARRLRISDLPVTSFQTWRRQTAGYNDRTGRGTIPT